MTARQRRQPRARTKMLDVHQAGNKLLLFAIALVVTLGALSLPARPPSGSFTVLALYPGNTEEAHMSFVREANEWFARAAATNHFIYRSTTNWGDLNDQILAQCQVVLFLDARPESTPQREAFRKFMEAGGGWMGFHFAGFALTPSEFPQNWDWYHNEFLGSGSYVGNTWKPTSAVLRVENRKHPATRHLPETFRSAPNEWYKWSNDLRTNANIEILLSIDPASYPLGTGPKPHEIWHEGYFPVVWTNKRYRMVYFNMGHNDLEGDKSHSSTFESEPQNRLMLDTLLWLGTGEK
jgi:uncharacterized protein